MHQTVSFGQVYCKFNVLNSVLWRLGANNIFDDVENFEYYNFPYSNELTFVSSHIGAMQ